MMKNVSKNWLLYIFIGCIAILSIGGFTQRASAHGYVKSPESRSYLCAQKVNKECGAIIYEPQSLEALGNFPKTGPADGKIASANGAFPNLDEQSLTRWSKVAMKSGKQKFTWHFTAQHATAKWDYYITKKDWDPNKPLKRKDLQLFCTVQGNNKRPAAEVTHTCTVPERTGYNVIVAYWEIGDTKNAFYNVIDANFDGNSVLPNDTPHKEQNSENKTWQQSKVYVAGDEVVYEGITYRAKWWTQGERPNKAQVWQRDTTPNNQSKVPIWDTEKAYVGGDEVLYNSKKYRAKWWTKGEKPNTSPVWQLLPTAYVMKSN